VAAASVLPDEDEKTMTNRMMRMDPLFFGRRNMRAGCRIAQNHFQNNAAAADETMGWDALSPPVWAFG
jgi:hypothetical protein